VADAGWIEFKTAAFFANGWNLAETADLESGNPANEQGTLVDPFSKKKCEFPGSRIQSVRNIFRA
jgi:hypothetical protein